MALVLRTSRDLTVRRALRVAKRNAVHTGLWQRQR